MTRCRIQCIKRSGIRNRLYKLCRDISSAGSRISKMALERGETEIEYLFNFAVRKIDEWNILLKKRSAWETLDGFDMIEESRPLDIAIRNELQSL